MHRNLLQVKLAAVEVDRGDDVLEAGRFDAEILGASGLQQVIFNLYDNY